MRNIIKSILAVILAACIASCATVRKDSSKQKEQHKKDSTGVSLSGYTREIETTTTSLTPGYTKTDSASVIRYTPTEDTGSWSQSVRSGALSVDVKSIPKKDSSGKVIGREMSVRAKKEAEEVLAPVTTHTIIRESGNSKQETKLSESDNKTVIEKKKVVTRSTAWFSITAGIAGVILVAWLIYSLYKRFKNVGQ